MGAAEGGRGSGDCGRGEGDEVTVKVEVEGLWGGERGWERPSEGGAAGCGRGVETVWRCGGAGDEVEWVGRQSGGGWTWSGRAGVKGAG